MSILNQKIALVLYHRWFQQKVNAGFHLPEKCPTIEHNGNDDEYLNNDIIHCGKCCSELCGFEKLDKFKQKEYEDKAAIWMSDLNKEGLKIIDL